MGGYQYRGNDPGVLKQPPPVPIPVEPATEKPASTAVHQLLDLAANHPVARIRTAAEKAADAVLKVRRLLDEDKEKAAVRDDIQRLEQELAAAKAKLRKTPPSSKAASIPSSTRAEHLLECDHEGCGKPFGTSQGLSLHKRRAHGA